MPPKSPARRKDNADVVEGEDPMVFLQNYQKYSRLIGVPIHQSVVKCLTNEEALPIDQIIVDEEHGALGPGGTRALMTALLGTAQGMKGGPYRPLKYLRFWRSNIEDEGVNAIVRNIQPDWLVREITSVHVLLERGSASWRR
jgi:hypothetical protein